MNALCEVCRHHWYDRTNRRDVAWLFAGARVRLEGDERALRELEGLERQCSKLAEFHICTYDGSFEPVIPDDEFECETWEAVA